jgi:hypothetical protein
MVRYCILLLLGGACAQGGSCHGGSQCTYGTSLNITNSTGACIHNPFINGTCEVCTTCHSSYPSCPCCWDAYDEANSCSKCFVLNAYNIEKCGNHPVSYDCDYSEADPCSPAPGTEGTYETLAECRKGCQDTYNCQNPGTTKAQCIQASSSSGFYPTKTKCQAVCKGPSPTPKPKPTPSPPKPTPPTPAPPTPASPTPAPPGPGPNACSGKSAGLAAVECAAWQDFYDATNGPHWSECYDARSDPCSCSTSDAEANCTGGHITYMYLPGNNLRGTIPSSLAKLSKLTVLALYDNRLTGLLPPLPFAQYTGGDPGYGCHLDAPSCTEPNCNHFKCPLPAGSKQCNGGVHCK